VRKSILKSIEEALDLNPDVIFIGSDLGHGVLNEARKKNPDRVLIEGISEQHIIGMASGLALGGHKVFVHTIGTFLYRRAYEQIYIDVALHNLNVFIVGSGGGMVYAPLGPTHQSVEDIKILSSIPGLKIFLPCDSYETQQIVKSCLVNQGPAYVRLGKGGEKIISNSWREIPGFHSKVANEGDTLTVVSCGAISQEVFAAISRAKELGINPRHIHIAEFGELDSDEILNEITLQTKGILIVEEHIPSGGLKSKILENLNQMQIAINHLSLSFEFSTNYGSQKEHWVKNGIDSENILIKIQDLYM
jgi:transketolase